MLIHLQRVILENSYNFCLSIFVEFERDHIPFAQISYFESNKCHSSLHMRLSHNIWSLFEVLLNFLRLWNNSSIYVENYNLSESELNKDMLVRYEKHLFNFKDLLIAYSIQGAGTRWWFYQKAMAFLIHLPNCYNLRTKWHAYRTFNSPFAFIRRFNYCCFVKWDKTFFNLASIKSFWITNFEFRA